MVKLRKLHVECCWKKGQLLALLFALTVTENVVTLTSLFCVPIELTTYTVSAEKQSYRPLSRLSKNSSQL